MDKIELIGKPNYKKLTEDYNFFRLFKKIEKKFDTCFLFESLGEESYISRYHILGFDPKYIIYPTHENLIIENKNGKIDKIQCKNPYYKIRDVIPSNIISKKYAGGLIGYLGYDCVNYFEPSLNIKNNDDFESFKFGVFLDGLVYDQVTGEIFYYYYDEDRFDLIEKILNENFEDNSNCLVAF